MRSLKIVALALVALALFFGQSLGASFFWKSSLVDLQNVSTAASGDRGIVITDAGDVRFYRYTGSAWVEVDSITASSFTSSAADGEHYSDDSNSGAPSSTPTNEGARAYNRTSHRLSLYRSNWTTYWYPALSGTVATAGLVVMTSEGNLEPMASRTQCSAGYAPLGIDTEGDASGCWQVTPSAIGAASTGVNTFTSLNSFTAGIATGNGSTGPGFLRFLEDTDNGTDYSSITGGADAGTYPSFTFGGSQGSETFAITATDNMWTFSSGSGAAFTFTPAVTFSGGMTGNVTGNASTVTVADAADDTTTWVLLGTGQTGSLAPATDASLTYNASTGVLTATGFAGALTGNVTGTASGNIAGTLGATANVIPKASGTGGYTAQASGITEDGTDVSIGALNLVTTGQITGRVKVLELSSSCTIGSDCDSTSVRIAYGGWIRATAAITVTLPEIVASPSATQVGIGASVCVEARDGSEALVVDPNANDSVSIDGTKDTAGDSVTITGAGAYGCFLAVAADEWKLGGRSAAWTAN